MEYMILALIGLCVLLLAVMIVVMFVNKAGTESSIRSLMRESEHEKRREMSEMKNQIQDDVNELKDRMNRDLVMFQNSVIHSVREDMTLMNESSARRLNRIELAVSESLLKGFEKTNESFVVMSEQIARIDETQRHLQQLSQNIISLENILTDKKTRGAFGEIQLYSLLENVFGTDGQHYRKQMKLSNGCIADCVLLAPSPLNNLVVDSKFPLENYNRMMDAVPSSEQYRKAVQDFRKDVKNHIRAIADKYLIPAETSEFACMFIPAEAVFAQIVSQFDDLVQYSYQCKVYLVSPTTMMAYLNAIKAFYLNQERSLKVEEIQSEVMKLSKEFERFVQRWQIVTKDFDKLHGDMKNIDITADKIIRRFQQIESVELGQNEHSNEQNDL